MVVLGDFLGCGAWVGLVFALCWGACYIVCFCFWDDVMKLQQLRYAVEVFRHNLNVSEAAETLFTSQPGVSKQIRLLEDELGVQIFIRSGKRIVAVTQVGMEILETAEQVLRGVRNIKNIGGEFAKTERGSFTIGATHALLRFRLPDVLARFRELFPDVRLVLKQGSPADLMGMVLNGEVDLALTMDCSGEWDSLRALSFGEWRYVLVLPRDHELVSKGEISLADVAALPLLTYGFTFDGGALATRAFARARLSWHTVFESDDGGVLLDYVRLGLGAGLMDGAGFDGGRYQDLVALDVGHLFELGEYKVVVRSDGVLRGFAYDFMGLLDEGLTRERVNRLLFAPAVEDFSI